MKTKSALLTTLLIWCLINGTHGQNNCNIINSVTLSIGNSLGQILGPNIGCVNTNNPPNNASTQVNTAIPPNVWSQLTLTKAANNECKLFLNGEIIFTGNYANITYIWNSLKLGAGFGSQYYGFFKGFIDELRLSNVVRTPSEIQSNFLNNVPFSQDGNTLGLWHFDQSSGNVVNSSIGANGNISNATWVNGYYNNCLYFNGSNAYVNFPISVPTTSFTIEIWVKPENFQGGVLFQPYGINNADFGLYPFTPTTNYTWSTGATGNTITVNPSTTPFIWVSNGNCTDTLWFNTPTATNAIPNGISYQAIARNAQGIPLSDSPIQVKFTLLNGSLSGTTEYAELHSLTTNSLGLFSTNIGTGTAEFGTFENVNWGNGEKYLKVECNTGDGLIEMGTQQLMSVPYAMRSQTAAKASSIENVALPVFVDNAAALAGGLQAGQMYRTTSGALMIVY